MTEPSRTRLLWVVFLSLVVGCGRTEVPLPLGSEFNVFVVVGSSKDINGGQLAFSRDGVDWTSIGFPVWLSSVASGRRRAVVLDTRGNLYRSEDLETWSPVQMPALSGYSDVLFAGERFVILTRTPQSSGVQLLESFDGIDWRLDPMVAPFSEHFAFSHDATGALWVTTEFEVYAFGASRAWVKQDIPRFDDAVFSGGELLTLGDTNFGRTSDGARWTFTTAPPAGSITKTREAVLLSTDEGFIVKYSEGGGRDFLVSPTTQPVQLIGHERTVIARGNGQWSSQDEGKTWVPITSPGRFIGLGARSLHLK